MNNEISTFLGIFLGGLAIVLFVLDKIFKNESDIKKIESKMDHIFKKTDELLESENEVLNISNELYSSQQLRPDLYIIVHKQWEFVEKTFHNRFEKHSICRRIVTNHINSDTNLLLDSGSTIDLVTFELLTSNKTNINVLSNNLFAAMHLIGEKKISLRLLPGLFNDKYAATYSKEALTQIADDDFSVIILATTALSYIDGIMVLNADSENYAFKRAVIENFKQSRNAKLIIAADATKFIENMDNHRSVLSKHEWASLISDHASRIFIVTTPLRKEIDPIQRAAFDQQIELFEALMIDVDRNS